MSKEKHPLKDYFYSHLQVARIAQERCDELTVEKVDGTLVTGTFNGFDDKWAFERKLTEGVKGFEYITRTNLTVKDLNQYGKFGWELVQIQPTKVNVEGQWKQEDVFWLKRRKD